MAHPKQLSPIQQLILSANEISKSIIIIAKQEKMTTIKQQCRAINVQADFLQLPSNTPSLSVLVASCILKKNNCAIYLHANMIIRNHEAWIHSVKAIIEHSKPAYGDSWIYCGAKGELISKFETLNPINFYAIKMSLSSKSVINERLFRLGNYSDITKILGAKSNLDISGCRLKI